MKKIETPVDFLRTYLQYIGYRFYIIFSFVGVAALLEGVGITLLLPLLKTLQVESEADGGFAFRLLDSMLEGIGIADSSIGILIFIAALFVVKAGFQFSSKAYEGYLNSCLLFELKEKLFHHFSKMNYQYYTHRNTGHFINVVNAQVDAFTRSFGFFVRFLTNIIMAICYVAIALVVSWRFGVMTLAIVGILLFPLQRLNQYVRELSRHASHEAGTLNKLLVQVLHAYKYIVSTAQAAHVHSRVTDSVRRLTSYKLRKEIAEAITGTIREPITVVTIVGIVSVQVLVLGEPLAPILIAILLFNRSLQSIMGVQSNWQHTVSLSGSVEMVDEEFRQVRQHHEKDGSVSIEHFSDEIRLEDISFQYQDADENAVHGITLSIPVNSMVAFVGRSGAGKSTLVDLLTLLLRPSQGAMYIDDIPAQDVDLFSWRSKIGYVSQETVIFDDTIANNIGLWNEGNASNTSQKIREAAMQASAHEFIQNLPKGYQTSVGDRGIRLSGGQKQRLFIARELYKEPDLLLLDEATSSLDTESERYIQQSIDRLKGKVTVVIIAHRLSTIKDVDHIYVLEDGEIAEHGPYEELRSRHESWFREMAKQQSL